MTVFDLTTLTTTNLGQAAKPLFLTAGNTVVFRTKEGEQSTDLNSDSDFNDDILQYQGF